ncbi:MAG: YajQ family cyclic di-GMP-binding protein, partial [Coriobacteriales bacterium]|nr:YajQ family cyclic di-GMP-binding protein [Coriobacteriales bacterium]
MAKDESFDVVSEVNLQEVDNAYQQTRKELAQRYDLKDSKAVIEFDKSSCRFTLTAPSEFVARQVMDVLNTKLVHRKVDLKSVKWSEPEAASGMTVRFIGTIVSGIDRDTAGKISKDVRALKLKNVKVQIEGEKLRLFSPKRDVLKEVIAFLKEKDYGQP